MDNTFFIGIDPGLTGALAVLNAGGQLVAVHDLPTVPDGRGKSASGRVLDFLGLTQLLTPYAGAMAALERVASRPDMARAAAFSFGGSYEICRCALKANGSPLHLYAPSAWKSDLNIVATTDTKAKKEITRGMALDLWPSHREFFARVKDHDRAEAALIARVLWLRERNTAEASA